jgi:hypothetical protein
MKISHDELKKIYKTHIQRTAPQSREGCPSPQRIFDLLASSGPGKEKEQLVEHLTHCSYCLREFELLLELCRDKQQFIQEIADHYKQRKLVPDDPGKKRKFQRFHPSQIITWGRTWKFAAGLILISIIASLFLLTRWPPLIKRDLNRGKPPGEIHLLTPINRESVKGPLVFRWVGVAQAEYYLLQVFDESLSPIWKSPPIQKSLYAFPSVVAEQMQDGRSYFWMVTGFLSDGSASESSLEEFSVRR